MTKPLRVLMLEDCKDDSDLLIQELRRHGYAPTVSRVETSEQMASALDKEHWDVILSDYSLPQFSAPDALTLLKSKGIDLPFIVVSGSIGEDRAISVLKAGAHDFITKGSISRLVPAVEREMRDADDRLARRTAEEALTRYANEVTDLYDNAPCGYHSLGSDGEFIRINKTELSWLGYSHADVIGKKRFVDVLTHTSARAFEKTFERFKKEGCVPEPEYEMVRADGTVIPVLLSVTPVKDSAGNFIMSRSIVFDTSERKRLEEQLRQSQKMDAIGQLAGGVAHDFNNLLTVINGRSQLLLSRLDSSDPMCRELELIYKTGERAATLTRQLLAFGRRQTLAPKILNLNGVIADMEKMLRRLVPENIDMLMVLKPDLGQVRVDAGQIEQVVMNLVINARDAILEQGTITVETGHVVLDRTYAQTHANINPGPYVMLSISDTGCGMSDAVKARVFEPFFTTKEQGKGTGLGLSTVYGIVMQSGGHIDVCSEVGQGTTFKVYLPRVEGSCTDLKPVASNNGARK